MFYSFSSAAGASAVSSAGLDRFDSLDGFRFGELRLRLFEIGLTRGSGFGGLSGGFRLGHVIAVRHIGTAAGKAAGADLRGGQLRARILRGALGGADRSKTLLLGVALMRGETLLARVGVDLRLALGFETLGLGAAWLPSRRPSCAAPR